MEINRLNNRFNISQKGIQYSNKEDKAAQDKSQNLIKELDKMSMINNVNIQKRDYGLNLSMEELEKRTHKDYLTTKKMLAVDAPEYNNLSEGDKKALKHLVKAAAVLDKVEMQIDSHHNLAFKEYLEK